MGFDRPEEFPQTTFPFQLNSAMLTPQTQGPSLAETTPPPGWNDATTVMMRNIPNKYTQQMLLSEISQAGFLGTFDFLYLPIDPETQANRGYAFLNFVSSSHAWNFKLAYDGRQMKNFNSSKVASVVKATLQGFDANFAHYSSTRVNKGDPTARPLFLREPENICLMQRGKDNNKNRGARRKGIDSRNTDKVVAPTAPLPQPPSPYPGSETCGGLIQNTVDASPGPLAPSLSEGGNKQQFEAKFCCHCGGPIKSTFQFCPHCGQTVMPAAIDALMGA